MFRLASFDLSGRRILIIEEEDDIALRMAEEIEQSGGVAVGPVIDIETALASIGQATHIDCVMLDVRHISECDLPVISVFGDLNIEVVFVTGNDDWFLAGDA